MHREGVAGQWLSRGRSVVFTSHFGGEPYIKSNRFYLLFGCPSIGKMDAWEQQEN